MTSSPSSSTHPRTPGPTADPAVAYALTGIVRSFLHDLAVARTTEISSCASHVADSSAEENRKRLLSTLHEFSMRFRADGDRELAAMAASILGVIGGGLACSSGAPTSIAWCFDRAIDRLEARIVAGVGQVIPWEPDGLGVRVSDELNAIAGELPQGASTSALGDSAIQAASVLSLVAGTSDAVSDVDSQPEGAAP